MFDIAVVGDFDAARQWYESTFAAAVREGRGDRLPLSLECGGVEAWAFLAACSVEDNAQPAPRATRHTITARAGNGVVIRCEVTCYDDFPVIEWVVYVRNDAHADSPILADILPLVTTMPCATDAPCVLHHAKGSDCKIDDFAPLETPLLVGAEAGLLPVAGRSSNGTLPFFNLETGEKGIIGAVGWTGGWKVHLQRKADGAVRLSAGMDRTHLKLHPGEEIRTPRIALLFWQGDRIGAHSAWRRFLLAHHTPRPNGQLLQAPVCFSVWGENHAANQIAKAKWLKDHDIPIDCFWIDAGWHGDGVFKEGSTVFNSEWYRHVGNWWPNKATYPEGLKPVGDAVREMGFGFLLWLEPERVFRETYFTREHPEWLLGPIGDNYLFNLGLPEAREAITDLISGLIEEGGITVYRQDFNTDPAPFWEAADAPDRVGMSEIRHIEGLYAFWDDLLARHPGLVIDNCSSGGRRIDLETISRSIPLWRSDFQCWPAFDPIAIQGQTHGLAPWVPLSTGCFDRPDTYAARSALGPGVVIGTNEFEALPTDHFPPDWLRQAVREQLEVRRYFYGDFHPLSSYDLAPDHWAVWQFDRPDLGEGMVLALRRPESPYVRFEAWPRALDPAAEYEIRCADSGETQRATGRKWRDEGLLIDIAERPGSRLFIYRRVGE
jgi:alpha-galactosidase